MKFSIFQRFHKKISTQFNRSL